MQLGPLSFYQVNTLAAERLYGIAAQYALSLIHISADQLKLNTPWNICIIYLGFGAGLAVFMFTGFMTVSYTHLRSLSWAAGTPWRW